MRLEVAYRGRIISPFTAVLLGEDTMVSERMRVVGVKIVQCLLLLVNC